MVDLDRSLYPGLTATDDGISRYITEGDTRRALHELHDEMEQYTDSLLYHLTW